MLLDVIEFLPPRSAFKTALTGSGWPEDIQIAAKTHDLVAALVSVQTGAEYSTWLPPVEREKYAEALAEAERDSDLLGSVFERAGWSFQ